MTIKQLLTQRALRLQTIPDKFLSDVEKSEKKIIAGILEQLSRLDVTGGLIVKSDSNLKLVADIREAIQKVVLSSPYSKGVKQFAVEFDKQAELMDSYFKKVFDALPTPFPDEVLQGMKTRTVQALINEPLDTAFIRPIENLLYDSVSTGAGITDTIKTIREFVETTPEGNGKLLQHSKQIAHDAYAISDRAYVAARSDELGIEWYLYAGGQIPTTRPFCLERHENYYHKKEIEQWGNGQKTEGLSLPNSAGEWGGKIEGTNAQTIFSYAGGWNCQHTISPVSINSVPRDVIDRVIAEGFFEPTEQEIELLGL